MKKKEIVLENIEREIVNLSPNEQLKLVEKIAYLLRKRGIADAEKLEWRSLYGLGKGLWNSEDAQEYVNRLRAER